MKSVAIIQLCSLPGSTDMIGSASGDCNDDDCKMHLSCYFVRCRLPNHTEERPRGD